MDIFIRISRGAINILKNIYGALSLPWRFVGADIDRDKFKCSAGRSVRLCVSRVVAGGIARCAMRSPY